MTLPLPFLRGRRCDRRAQCEESASLDRLRNAAEEERIRTRSLSQAIGKRAPRSVPIRGERKNTTERGGKRTNAETALRTSLCAGTLCLLSRFRNRFRNNWFSGQILLAGFDWHNSPKDQIHNYTRVTAPAGLGPWFKRRTNRVK